MSPITRRGFISGTAAGVAATGVALAIPGQLASATTRLRNTSDAASTHDEAPLESLLSEPLIAHVRDLSSGEISLFSGEHEFTIRDRHLASSLVRATRSTHNVAHSATSMTGGR